MIVLADRISDIQHDLRTHEVDAALLTFLPAIRWACGFTGSNGLLLVHPSQAHFLSDGRYAEQARREVEGAEVHIPGYELFDHIAEQHLFGDARQVLFQADHVTVAQLQQWQERFPSLRWIPVEGFLDRRMAAKEEGEVERVRRAQQMTDAVFDHLLDVIKPGMAEREVAAEIVYQHLRRGADTMAFDPIVASGPNGALPHARPTGRTLQAGDLVVIDMGAYVDGYASDMTRTLAIGEPGPEARAVYTLVRTAQEQALAAAQAGMSSKALDSVARDIIKEGGYGDYFSHGLGHGVGLQVHEWPRVSYHVDEELPVGAVVTVEPGVYVPDRFGVRIEDLIVLQATGCENLTRSPKELIVL